MTMRVLPSICALVLGVAAALFAGCGDRSGLLPSGSASNLKRELGAVQQAVDAKDCPATDSAIERARNAVKNADGLDSRLRSRLLSGIGQLSGRAKSECVAEAPQKTLTQEVPTTEETVPPETTSTEDTQPAEPTDPTDTGTPSTPVDPTQTDPSGGGVSPDTPVDPGTGTITPDPGGADPSDPGTGDDQGFRATGRDRSGPEGYYP